MSVRRRMIKKNPDAELTFGVRPPLVTSVQEHAQRYRQDQNRLFYYHIHIVHYRSE